LAHSQKQNNNNVVEGGGGEDDWTTLLPIVPLMPGYKGMHHHLFEESKEVTSCMIGGITHLRLNYFPNGKVVRIKAYGRLVGRMTPTKMTTAPDKGVAPSLYVGQTIFNRDNLSLSSSRDAPPLLPSMHQHTRPEGNVGMQISCHDDTGGLQ
jgi:hypothetical protein